jgi:hypothetical protein
MYKNAYGLMFVLSSAILLTVLSVFGYLFWGAVGAALVPGIAATGIVTRLYFR